MAGVTHAVAMGDDAHMPAWQTVRELGASGVAGRITIVGGLMVDLHARRAGVRMLRSTDDLDVLVDVIGDRDAYASLGATLRARGFVLGEHAHAYRFTHPDGRQVDLMVPDHLPRSVGTPRLGRRPAFEAPGGAQAVARRDWYELDLDGTPVRVGVPDSLGALVAKGAAYEVDRRDRDRHLSDAAILLAAFDRPSQVDYAVLSKNDRKRLRLLHEQIGNPGHPAWTEMNDATRTDAQRRLGIIAKALGQQPPR